MSFLFLCVGSLFLGCSYPMGQLGLFKGSLPALEDVQVLEADDTVLTFEVVSERALKSCSECHGFTKSSDTVMARKAKILDRINGLGGEIMPPPSKGYEPLNECQKKMIETFFDDQASQRSAARIKDIPACSGKATLEPTPVPTPTPTPPPAEEKEPVDFKTLDVNFENLKREILEPKCLRCHTEAAAKSTILETVSFMQGQELLGNPAETSKLYKVVIPGMASRLMPPPRSGIPPLTADEADYLKRWIESTPASEWDF